MLCCLFVCKLCGLYEGCLTTDCPNKESYNEHGDKIYRGEEDFVAGEWRMGCISPHSPASYTSTGP